MKEKKKPRWIRCLLLGVALSLPVIGAEQFIIQHGWEEFGCLVAGMVLILMLLVSVAGCAPVGTCSHSR